MYSENVPKINKSLQDVGSEFAVLAGICQYGKDGLYDVCDIITEKTFTVQENKYIYKCLETGLTTSDKLDTTTILSTANMLGLSQHIFKDKKDIEFLKTLFNLHIEKENIRVAAKKIAKLEVARISQQKLKEAHDKLYGITGSESIDAIMAIPEDCVFAIMKEINNDGNDGPQLIGKEVDEILEQLMENPVEMVGIPTPWASYNHAIGGGLRRGGVNLIGARPKRGKSTLGKENAIHFAKMMDIPVLYLDTEMVRGDQLFRCLASLSGVPLSQIETGKFGKNSLEKARVIDASKQLKGMRLYHEKIAGKPFPEVLSIIRRWILREVGKDETGNTKDCLVIYDYFKLMDDSKLKEMQEYQALGFQISSMSDFCKEYDFACLAFVQLNRDGATEDSSEVVSQSDRLLWLCHSFSIFREKSNEEIAEDGKESGNRRLKVLDVRFGPGMEDGDYINMKMEGDINRITELGTKKSLKQNPNLNKPAGFEINDDDGKEIDL